MAANNESRCLCSSSSNDSTVIKSVGVLNPAFNDIDISKIQFEESTPWPYFSNVQTQSEEGLTYIEIGVASDDTDNQMHLTSEINGANMLNPSLPKRKLKKTNDKFCSHLLWILVWLIVVVSLAGIFATVACIVWLETYNEELMEKNSNLLFFENTSYDDVNQTYTSDPNDMDIYENV